MKQASVRHEAHNLFGLVIVQSGKPGLCLILLTQDELYLS